MKTYRATLTGHSPYSQSRHYTVDKLDREQPDAYERRTWRGRMHVDEHGHVFIPPMAIKNCLSEAAKFLGLQIKGKQKCTYTKHFEAGVIVLDPIGLGIVANDVQGESLFVPASGKRGDGKRVDRIFPFIPPGWSGEASIVVIDQTITAEILELHLVEAGNLIGIGRFRPRNNGYYGRFKVSEFREASA
jgi:hypothetical protein